jgi:hypothetical protein
MLLLLGAESTLSSSRTEYTATQSINKLPALNNASGRVLCGAILDSRADHERADYKGRRQNRH